MPDVQIETRDGLTLLRPLSPTGEAWIEDTILIFGWWPWTAALQIDPTQAASLLRVARADGLEVSE